MSLKKQRFKLINGDVKKFKNHKTFITHLGWNKVFLEENEYLKYFKNLKKNFYLHIHILLIHRIKMKLLNQNMVIKNFVL